MAAESSKSSKTARHTVENDCPKRPHTALTSDAG